MDMHKFPSLVTFILTTFLVACSNVPVENLQATIDVAVAGTAEAQRNIQATIDSSVKSTVHAQDNQRPVPEPTLEPIAKITDSPSPTMVATTESATFISAPSIFPCQGEKRSETCYNMPAYKGGRFYITVWIKDFDNKKIPHVIIGDARLECQIASYEQHKQNISCSINLSSLPKGETTIQIIALNDDLLADGIITIVNWVTPTPLPTKRSYPNP